ncbi:MAG: ribbon-helix-helix protein, CopG family [Candidatus Paceibacterota bacterium]|jgi:hypothetical protein
MTEQVIIKMDSKLKRGVQKRAKAEGTTLSSVLRQAAMDYYAGQTRMGLIDLSWAPVEKEEVNAKTKRDLAKAHNDYKMGKNMSPVFHSAESMIEYLNHLDERKSRR